MTLKRILPVLAGILLLAACSGKSGGREMKEYVSSFLNKNEKIVAFGKADIQQILEKADYASIPKLGSILKKELEKAQRGLNTSSGVHFALEGPLDNKGNPAALYAFFDVKDKDSLADRLGYSGLFVEEDGDMKYTLDNDVSIGIVNDLAILISKKEKYDGKKALEEAFDRVGGDKAGGKIDGILDTQGDIVFGISIGNLYGTSNTDLSRLDESKQKELKELAKDSYIRSAITFEKGRAVFESTNLFSEALKQRMFLKEEGNEELLSKLGKGKARLGLATNFDMEKLESFLDDFAPELKNKITGKNAALKLTMMSLGSRPLANLLSGKMGFVMVGDLLRDGSLTPEINFHVGLGRKGHTAAETASAFFSMGGAAGNGEQFSYNGMDFRINDREITGNTKNAGAGVTSLVLPSCAASFGKQGITGFANFEGLDLEGFGFRGAAKTLNVVKDLSFEMNNRGAKIVVNAKNPDQNILKQIVDLYLRDIETKISGLTL